METGRPGPAKVTDVGGISSHAAINARECCLRLLNGVPREGGKEGKREGGREWGSLTEWSAASTRWHTMARGSCEMFHLQLGVFGQVPAALHHGSHCRDFEDPNRR